MNKKQFELQFNATMEISDIRKKLDSLTGSLDKLQLPANVTKNLEAALTKTLNQLNNFEALSERGMENLSDTKNLEKSWASVVNSLNSISAALKSIDTSKVFPKEVKDNIKAAEDAMAKYVQKLEQAKQSPKYQAEESKRGQILANETQAQKNLANAQNALAKAETALAEKRGAWGEAAQQRYAEEEQNLKDINELYKLQEELIKRLEKEKEQLQSEGYLNSKGEAYADSTLAKKGLADTNKIKRASAVGKELNAARTEQAQYGAAREKAQRNFDKAKKPKEDFEKAEEVVQTLNKDVQEYTELLQSAQEATAAFEQTLENIAKGEAAEFWKNLVDTLSKIPGLNLDEAADDVEDVGEALSEYKTKELDKVPKVMEDIRQEFKETEGPIKNVDDALREAGKTSEDLAKASDEIEHLKQQVLDFFSVSNAINIFKRALSDAFQTVKELDAVMTEAAVVTDFSVGDMWEQMPQYSKNASELGVATKDLYAATTLYYQQGLKGNEVVRVGAETMKMAKIANMDATEATQAMTAALRGFNMEVDELNAQRVNDVYSKLAAITASDTSQIATAMSKTASIAASANMEFETTAAFLAQIIETTQEAPETAGTALKTIIARFSEVKELQSQGLTTGVDAEGEVIDINKISTALRSVGISMDAFFAGQEGLDEVLLRLSEKWNTLDFTTQHYIATTAAGSRQQSRFMAMMSNYGRTMELVGEANNSAGASQEQYEKTLESLEFKLARLKNAWDQFTMGLANNELVKFGVDTLTWILETVNKLTDAISGGNGLAKSIVSLGTVIGALKLGGKVLGKNSSTGGLLGKVSGLVSGKNDTKKEYTRGKKDGQSYGQGWKDGVKVATSKMPDPPELTPDNLDDVNNNLDKTATKFNTVGAAMVGVGAACGLLATAFQAAGMEEAAEVTQVLAAVFTTLGTVIPIVGQLIVTFGGEAAAAGLAAQAAWWPLLAITAIVAGIAVAWALIAKSAKEKSFEHRLEKAKEATENAKQAAEEAKAAYEELLDAKSGYSELQKTLSNLTKGTNEWRAALVESNQQVLELIDKYPELAKYLTTNEYGQMAITEEGFTELEGQLVEQSKNSQAALAAAQNYEGEMTAEESVQALLAEGKIKQSDRDMIVEMVRNQDKEGLQEYYKKQQNEYLSKYSALQQGGIVFGLGTAEKQMKAMEDIVNSMEAYAQQIEAQTEAVKAQTAALLVYTNDETKTSDYSGYVGAYAEKNADRIAADIQSKTETYLSSFNSEEAMRNQYKTTMGYEAAEGMSLETMAREMAGVDVGKFESERVDKVVEGMEGIKDPAMREYAYAMLSGDQSRLTMSDIQKTYTNDELASALGYATTEDLYKETGMDSGAMSTARYNLMLAGFDLKERIGREVYTRNEGFLGGLDLDLVKKIADQLNTGDLSNEQKNNLISTLKNVLADSDLDENGRLELENLLATTDWSDSTQALDAMDRMFALGVDKDTIMEYWAAATAGVDGYIKSEEEALKFATRMQNKISDVTDLSERLAEGTATWEDLMLLQKAGVDTSSYTLTANGWQSTAEQTQIATDALREYYLEQAKLKEIELADAYATETDMKKRQELQDSLEIVKKTREMLEQPITTTYKVETHIDLLDRIKEAIVFDRQKEIDKLSEINDTIADSNSRIVTAMRESVEDSRRARENERTEQEIADKQARLSYLKMDTSGANAMEIKRLEEEIAQDQESYTDRLIDEKITALEEQNNIAQEQRAQQIELMQLQLEQDKNSGALWTYVEKLFKDGYDATTGKLREDSEAYKLLYQAESVASMSAVAQEEWKKGLLEAFKGVHIHIYPPATEPDKGGDKDNEPVGNRLPPLSHRLLGIIPKQSPVFVEQHFASGGLADFTGPAWLDGTKTNPEYVLSAAQTERFFTLVDILEGLKVAPANSTQNNRENNFDIDINVESINSDYDVEQVAIKVKDFIVNSSRYRNNNTL